MSNILVIILLLSSIMMVTGLSILQETHQVFALSKFFNCMTELANGHHTLTVDDVDSCYHKEFHSS